jgi:ABC-2 type transport system ATP-binding protein
MSLALRVRGLQKSYGSHAVLKGVDLEVPTGVVFGLVGPNGAGKTTLFSTVSGYLPQDAGAVEHFGAHTPPGGAPPKGTYSILPQDAAFLPTVNLGAQLEFYGRLQGLSVKEAKSERARVLDSVGLSEVARQKPATLSHGMHKRVGIAQAFIGTPRLVILDEPTAGLDPSAARQVRGLIRELSRASTVMVSSHNLSEMEDLCSEFAILHEGRIVRQDNLAGVIGGAAVVIFRLGGEVSEALREAMLALPCVTDLDWSNDRERLRVHFDPEVLAPPKAAQAMLGVLVDRGTPFVEMQLGKSLEDRFIEETTGVDSAG